MAETITYTCSICSEPAADICVYCTKDACPNHRCDKCLRCSDCCDCELQLDEEQRHEKEDIMHARAESNGAGGELPGPDSGDLTRPGY